MFEFICNILFSILVRTEDEQEENSITDSTLSKTDKTTVSCLHHSLHNHREIGKMLKKILANMQSCITTKIQCRKMEKSFISCRENPNASIDQSISKASIEVVNQNGYISLLFYVRLSTAVVKEQP